VRNFLIVAGFLFVITLPLIGIGLVMISKVNDAYHRGYQDGIDSMSIDKQCAKWLFDDNLTDAKQRICK